MRRVIGMAGVVLAGSLAMGAIRIGRAQLILANGPAVNFPNAPPQNFRFNGRRWYRPEQPDDAMLRQQVGALLGMPRAAGMDDWAWHDSVEDGLVALGQSQERAVPMIMEQIEAGRTGYELDALEVAAFRLENMPVNPREAAAAWAGRQPGSEGKVAAPAAKVMRVMGIRAGARGLFPHHLFYAVEWRATQTRVVVAVAADSKVQAISDDASLARFLRVELPAIHTEAGQQRVTAAAAVLGMARFVTLYQPEGISVTGESHTMAAHLNGEAHRLKTSVTFDDSGRVAAVNTADDAMPVAPAIPVLAPTSTQAPAMPE